MMHGHMDVKKIDYIMLLRNDAIFMPDNKVKNTETLS